MNSEEFQKLVLEKLSKLDIIETDVKELKKDIKEVEIDIKEVKRDVKGIWGDILHIDNRLTSQEEIVGKIVK